MGFTNKPPGVWIPTITEKLHDLVNSLIYENERLLTELQTLRTLKAEEAFHKAMEKPKEPGKVSKGYSMTFDIVDFGTYKVIYGHVYQDGRLVFTAKGFRSKEHAERILRQLTVEYALVEMPTL